MSRRIGVNRGAKDMITRDLGRRLRGIVTNLRFGLITRAQARHQGRLAIESEYETMLRVSRDRVRFAVGRVGVLPPEARHQMERWRDEYTGDFYAIIDDVIRSRGV